MYINNFQNLQDLQNAHGLGAPSWKSISPTLALVAISFFFGASHILAATSQSASAPATQTNSQSSTNAAQSSSEAQKVERTFYIREYRVDGGENLIPKLDVEEAVYPYLGPYRTAGDVEQASAALEKVYRDKGFQTVAVQVPPQQVKGGVIMLKVVPSRVGRLRVEGSRYFSLQQIRDEAPSLAEGTVPNFNAVQRDVIGLNQMPDRKITPALSAGELPGTVDVNLNVKDTFPLHGSLELNNRYSADTTRLRLDGSLSYDNLWQMGHSIGGSFQISPEDPSQVNVFSGFYSAHPPGMDWLTLLLEGTVQDSSVSTLGGTGVVGKGDIVGLRAIINLPGKKDFYHSVSLGIDAKNYDQDLTTAGQQTVTPITYYPLSAAYSGTWLGKGYETDFDGSANLNIRGMGSSDNQFDINRHGATSSYIYYRSDLSHTHDLPEGVQVYAKLQGQVANVPLLNSEQFSGGGLDTVRGYLESEQLGDNAYFGSFELRSPSLAALLGKSVNDWRFYLFTEGGHMTINDPLPEQQSRFSLASYGGGTRFKLVNHVNGSVDFAVPMIQGVQTKLHSVMLTFRIWADF